MIGRSIPALIASALTASALRVPLERRLAGPPRDQDRQLELAWRQAGVGAQELAQRLPAVRQLGAVQRGAQRADDSAAAAGHHLVVDAALLGVHGLGRGKTKTWHQGGSRNRTASLRAASVNACRTGTSQPLGTRFKRRSLSGLGMGPRIADRDVRRNRADDADVPDALEVQHDMG